MGLLQESETSQQIVGLVAHFIGLHHTETMTTAKHQLPVPPELPASVQSQPPCVPALPAGRGRVLLSGYVFIMCDITPNDTSSLGLIVLKGF